MNDIQELLQFVATAVWHSWPAFLISIFLSVLVRALKLDGVIRRVFDKRVGISILLATLVGAFSPFCSCTVVPIIAGLLLSGVPLAPVMSFWIASPTMDPEILALSVGVLGWPLALVRLGATLALSLAAGYITLALSHTSFLRQVLPAREAAAVETSPPLSPLPRLQPALALATATGAFPVQPVPITVGASTRGGSSCQAPAGQRPANWRTQLATSFQEIEWTQFARDLLRESWGLGRWLLVAFLMEALITRYIPQAAVAAVLGRTTPGQCRWPR